MSIFGKVDSLPCKPFNLVYLGYILETVIRKELFCFSYSVAVYLSLYCKRWKQ